KAVESGEANAESFEKETLWTDIIGKLLRPIHDELLKIDKTVNDHRPSRFLNTIVDLLELKKLVEATKLVSTSNKVSMVDYWKEGWVKLSSLLIQLHHKYDWIFSHVY
ncbi:unnamed protein product, partial [Allacma fusca]